VVMVQVVVVVEGIKNVLNNAKAHLRQHALVTY